MALIPVRSVDAGPHHVCRRDGTVLDAELRVKRIDGALTITVEEARGGGRGSAGERNTDYKEGLELILARLANLGARIVDGTVVSRTTRSLPPEEKRIRIEGQSYPLEIDDPAELRRRIGSAGAKVGRVPGAWRRQSVDAYPDRGGGFLIDRD